MEFILERVLLLVSSILSILGCCFILYTWYALEIPNYVSRRIIGYLSISGFFMSCGFIMSVYVNGYIEDERREAFCYIQAYVLQFFYLSTYLWTACFTTHLYSIIALRSQRTELYMQRYSLVSWGIPALFVGILIVRQLKGYAGMGVDDRPWCWFSTHEDHGRWRSAGSWQQFGFFYIPTTIIFLYNVIMYIRIVPSLSGYSIENRVKSRIIWYIFIFFITYIWGLINRLLQMLQSKHEPIVILDILESFFDPIQPFLNALVYGTSRQVLRLFRVRCCYDRAALITILGLDSDTESDDFSEKSFNGGIDESRFNMIDHCGKNSPSSEDNELNTRLLEPI